MLLHNHTNREAPKMVAVPFSKDDRASIVAMQSTFFCFFFCFVFDFCLFMLTSSSKSLSTAENIQVCSISWALSLSRKQSRAREKEKKNGQLDLRSFGMPSGVAPGLAMVLGGLRMPSGHGS